MGSKKYPPLTYSEVLKILKVLGFTKDRQPGSSHEQYKGIIKGKRCLVTVDENESPFDVYIIKMMIRQSGVGYKKFYEATKKTAKKIRNVKNK